MKLARWFHVIVSFTLFISAAAAQTAPDLQSPPDNPYGFDLVIGPAGAHLQLAAGTIYGLDLFGGSIPFTVYTRMLAHGDLSSDVKIAVPIALGDTVQGKYPVVATLDKMFGRDDAGNVLPDDQIISYAPGKKLTLDQGSCFAANKFEAVVGSDIPKLTGLKIGSTFQATHGRPVLGETPDIHSQVWRVVGVLAPTGTAIDRKVFIPLLSFYAVSEHAAAMVSHNDVRSGDTQTEAFLASGEHLDGDKPPTVDASGIQHFKNYDLDTKAGTFKLTLAPEFWEVSAIEVQSVTRIAQEDLRLQLNGGGDGVVCVDPSDASRSLAALLNVCLELGIVPGDDSRDHSGVDVAAIVAESPAIAAGIHRGDVLTKIGDTEIRNCLDLFAVLAETKGGEKLKVHLRRGSETVNVVVATTGR